MFASPITWLWFSALPSSSTWYAADTVASHSWASSAVCVRYSSLTEYSPSAADSASSASRASATTDNPPCFTESNEATLMLTNRTPGSLNAVRDALVKSL